MFNFTLKNLILKLIITSFLLFLSGIGFLKSENLTEFEEYLQKFDFSKAYFFNDVSDIKNDSTPFLISEVFIEDDVSKKIKSLSIEKSSFWIVMWKKVYLYTNEKLYTLVQTQPYYLFYGNFSNYQNSNFYSDYSLINVDQFVYNSNMDDNYLIEKYFELYVSSEKNNPNLYKLDRANAKYFLKENEDFKTQFPQANSLIQDGKSSLKNYVINKANYDLVGFCVKSENCGLKELKSPAYYAEDILQNRICYDAQKTKKIVDYYGWSPEGCLYYNKVGAVFFENFIIVHHRRQTLAKIFVNEDLSIYISNPDIFAKFGFDYKKYNVWFSYKNSDVLEDLNIQNLVKILGLDKNKLNQETDNNSSGYKLAAYLINNF
jgi:hypothetical protein